MIVAIDARPLAFELTLELGRGEHAGQALGFTPASEEATALGTGEEGHGAVEVRGRRLAFRRLSVSGGTRCPYFGCPTA